MRKEKKSYVRVAKVYSKTPSPVCEIVNKEKEICASFAVATQTAKVTATVCGRCLVKMKNALNLYNQIFVGKGRKKKPCSHNFY